MAQSALQRLLDDKDTLSLVFAVAALRAIAGDAASEQLGSAAAGTGTGKKGGVSLLSLKPETLESTMKVLRHKIKKGEIKLPEGISPETALENIKTELKNSTDYNGRTLDQIVTSLKEKNLLKPEPKAPVFKPRDPRPLLGMAVRAFAPPAPAFG